MRDQSSDHASTVKNAGSEPTKKTPRNGVYQWIKEHKSVLEIAIAATGVLVSIFAVAYTDGCTPQHQLRSDQFNQSGKDHESKQQTPAVADSQSRDEYQYARKIYQDLKNSELAYDVLTPRVVVASEDYPALEEPLVVIDHTVDGFIAHFTLPYYAPRDTGAVRTTRVPNPSGDGYINILEPIRERDRVEVEVIAFGCADCDTTDRAEAYEAAKKLPKSNRADDQIILARAAFDMGDLSYAEEYLKRAIELLEQQDLSPVAANRIREQIIQTQIVQSGRDNSYSFDRVKRVWRDLMSPGKLGNLHETLLWEAEIAAFRNDTDKMLTLLEEYSEVVVQYALGPPQTSRLLEHAYVKCLAVLSSGGDSNPQLPVPTQYRMNAADHGWLHPIEIGSASEIKTWPPGLEWANPAPIAPPPAPTPADDSTSE